MATPPFSPAAELYPFRSRWFDAGAGRMHYLDEGTGRPILMLHGNPAWSFMYRTLIGRLRGRFRCVAPDYLGFGLSERPAGFGYTPAEHAMAIGELIRHLDLTDLIVMGHDWGGPIGLAVASEFTDRVTGAVLGNTWFWAADWPQWAFSKVMSTRPMQRRIRNDNFFVERVLFGNIVRELSEQEKEHYRAVQPTPELRAGVAEFPRQITAAHRWLTDLERSVRDKLAHLPVLVTYPRQDPGVAMRRTLRRFRATFDDIAVVRLNNARHFYLEDKSDEVAEALTARFAFSHRQRSVSPQQE